MGSLPAVRPSFLVLTTASCDVSDALVKLNVPSGGVLAGIVLWSPEQQAGATKIVGPAYTVQYAPLADPAPKHPTHYIDGVPAGAVVVMAGPRMPNAVFGGLMGARAQYQGAAGTVIDGRLRDLGEQRALGYPVFARGVSTASPNAVAKVVGVGVPVQIAVDDGGTPVDVRPGDLIVGDLNGVVVLPRALAEAALPLMRAQVAADEQMAAAIRQGMGFAEASKTFR